MKIFIAFSTAFALAIGFLGGCDDNNQGSAKLECPSGTGPFTIDDSRITGAMAFEPPTDPLGRGDSLFVTGTAFHEDGLAIREVRVAGISATRDEFNFGRWTASVTYEAIVTAAPTSAEGQVELQAVAVDACGKRYPFAVAVVGVDPSPHIAVDDLVVTVEYPEERTFIPASGAVPAIITITGSGRAAGAVVTVTSDSGNLRGLDDLGHVTLAAPPEETETGAASLIFTPNQAGTATIVVTVEDKLAVALVRVEGPPTLSPRRATLVPGSRIEVDLAGATEIACSASEDDDLLVTHFDAPLSSEPMTIEVDEGGRRVAVIEAVAEPLALETEVVVTCSDAFGQVGSGRYRLGAAGAAIPADGAAEPTPE